ncbi:MAG TPA: hypothetical protein ACHBX0_12410 [Arsenophonus sp.]
MAEKIVKAPKAETKPKSVEPVVEAPKAESKPEPVDIESIDLRHVVALSVLFGNKATKPDNKQVAKAKETFESRKAESVTGQIDALYCALNGLSKVQTLAKAKTFDLCLKMLSYRDDIPGITARRDFTLSLLRELPSPAEVKPVDYKALRSEASRLVTQRVREGA